MTWFDRTGRQVGTVGGPDANAGGRWIPTLAGWTATSLFRATVDGNTDVWLVELARNVRRRFTVDSAIEGFGVWSPDGSRLVFHSNRTGRNDLYLKPVTGGCTRNLAARILRLRNKNPQDWSPDGRLILYEQPQSEDW